MQIGYTEKEIAHMYFGKWADLFKEFKRMHNYKMKRMIFEEEKKVESLMDLYIKLCYDKSMKEARNEKK